MIEEGVQQRYVANRDARRFLPFLLPHVRSGMDVLDVGCGVGSIALDLAPAVAPGRVVGIDADSEQIEQARRSAAERVVENGCRGGTVQANASNPISMSAGAT